MFFDDKIRDINTYCFITTTLMAIAPRNAFIGYTYQDTVVYYLISLMDLKREIKSISIEADVPHNFDDISIAMSNEEYNIQTKDYKNININDISFEQDSVCIKNKATISLSHKINILIIKNIDNINTDCFILDLPAKQIFKNLYIISHSNESFMEKIENNFAHDNTRISILKSFYSQQKDKRKFNIKLEDLPKISFYSHELLEKTINVDSNTFTKHTNQKILILGKPGVGKSHFAKLLINHRKNESPIIYRFWISNQDVNFKDRLIYSNFLYEIQKNIFGNLEKKQESEILEELKNKNYLLILDGLDHVENYNEEDLKLFIKFIGQLESRIIVLSRPLKSQLNIENIDITELLNWDFQNTSLFLKESMDIRGYKTSNEIFKITKGYPILVKYLAEHYIKYQQLPLLEQLADLNDYYDKIILPDSVSSLTIFLTQHSYFTLDEIKSLISSNLLFDILKDILEKYPYLFEKKLSRISIFHDSFRKWLNSKKTVSEDELIKITNKVYNSIVNKEIKYLSRFNMFNFSKAQKTQVLKTYCSLKTFKEITNSFVDYESIVSFYHQLRHSLLELEFNTLSVTEYYSLALIINIITRDNTHDSYDFYYMLAKALNSSDYNAEAITSSGMLFGMYALIKENSSNIMLSLIKNSNAERKEEIKEISNSKEKNDNFFELLKYDLNESKILKHLLNTDECINFIKELLLPYLYNHSVEDIELASLKEIFIKYVDLDSLSPYEDLPNSIKKHLFNYNFYKYIFESAKEIVRALGVGSIGENFRKISLHDLILENQSSRSFDLHNKVINKIRLDLYTKNNCDIGSISKFYPYYNARKDYSVINIHKALYIFEQQGFLKPEQSCHIISCIQKLSEKGITNILNEYIELHSVEIIDIIINTLNTNDLEIYWFKLPSEYISYMDMEFFYQEMSSLLSRSYKKKINIENIENIIDSTHWWHVSKVLYEGAWTIVAPKNHPKIVDIQKYNINIEIEEQQKFKRNNNRKHIKLDILETSKELDPNCTALSDLTIYEKFNISDMKKNLQEIVYNSITLKAYSGSELFANLWNFLGNIPVLIHKYGDQNDLKELFNIFIEFLEISFLTDFNLEKVQ
ncbi:hypothetical protein B4919_06375 [Francisella tularensis subsp. novicida]|nr:hypothetical protein B4919_06375 [Francisella tularensis subsp. novicida]